MMMMMMMEQRRSSGKEKVSQAQETRRLTANRRRCPSWGSGKLWEKLCGAIPDQEWRWRSLTLSLSLSVCESVSLSSFSPQHRSHGSKGLLAPPYLTNNESPYRGIRSQPAALRSAGAADCHTTYYANGVSPRGRSVGGLFLSSSSSEEELLTSWVFLFSPPTPLITSSPIPEQLEMMHPSVLPSMHTHTSIIKQDDAAAHTGTGVSEF